MAGVDLSIQAAWVVVVADATDPFLEVLRRAVAESGLPRLAEEAPAMEWLGTQGPVSLASAYRFSSTDIGRPVSHLLAVSSELAGRIFTGTTGIPAGPMSGITVYVRRGGLDTLALLNGAPRDLARGLLPMSLTNL